MFARLVTRGSEVRVSLGHRSRRGFYEVVFVVCSASAPAGVSSDMLPNPRGDMRFLTIERIADPQRDFFGRVVWRK